MVLNKHKNKRFAARCASLIGALVILLGSVVPASATGIAASGNSTDLMHSVIPFDYWSITSNDSVASDNSFLLPWFYNTCYENNGVVHNDYELGEALWCKDEVMYNKSSSFMDAVFEPGWMPESYDLRLFSSDFYVNYSLLGSGSFVFSLTSDSTGLVPNARCTVVFDLVTLAVVDRNYVEVSTTYSTVLNGSVFDISSVIAGFVRSDDSLDNGSIVHIKNLAVVISGISQTEYFSISSYCTTSVTNAFTYFNSLDLFVPIMPPSTDQFSLDWLMKSVSGFLAVKLWPGVSLGGLLGTIFTLGLLFLFLKMAI